MKKRSKVKNRNKQRDTWEYIFLMNSWHSEPLTNAHKIAHDLFRPFAGRRDVRATWSVADKCKLVDVKDSKGSIDECLTALSKVQRASQASIGCLRKGSVSISLGEENNSYRVPPHASMKCGLATLDILESVSSSVQYVLEFFQHVADSGSCICACAHADSAFELSDGWLYTVFPYEQSTIQRAMKIRSWSEMICDERDRVRDIVWATCVGREMASKLPKTVIEDFNAQARQYRITKYNSKSKEIEHHYPLQQPLAFDLPNGCMAFFLGPDPRDNCIRPNLLPPADETAYLQLGIWLHKVFRKAGIV